MPIERLIVYLIVTGVDKSIKAGGSIFTARTDILIRMNDKLRAIPRDHEREAEILKAVNERYGEGALFTYYPEGDNRPHTMTLDQAMKICGAMIVRTSDAELWGILDKWRDEARKVEANSDAFTEASIGLGRNAVIRAQQAG